MVGVRDSKNTAGPALVFTPGEWEAFTAGVQDGEFNRPLALETREPRTSFDD
jgi:hypothetical protein